MTNVHFVTLAVLAKLIPPSDYWPTSLNCTTKRNILHWSTALEKQRKARFLVFDLDRVAFENAIRRRNIPLLQGGFELWRIAAYIKTLCQRKVSVNIFAGILSK
jgi:hypothetical protein